MGIEQRQENVEAFDEGQFEVNSSQGPAWHRALSPSQRNDFVTRLNELLRGEISAVETYKQAENQVQGEERNFVKQLETEHQEAVRTLRNYIVSLGGRPDENSGAWGVFAKTVTGTAKIFGDSTTLKALQSGEEKGLKDYEDFLADADIPDEVDLDIRVRFIPAQRRHIELLRNHMH